MAQLEPQLKNTPNLKCLHEVGILGLARRERLALASPSLSHCVRLELGSLNSFQIPHIKTPPNGGVLICGPPGEIRTPDTQVRSLVLYPAELRAERLSRSTGREVYHGFSMLTLAHCIRLDATLAAAFGRHSQGGMQ